jgi:hypothetical protein
MSDVSEPFYCAGLDKKMCPVPLSGMSDCLIAINSFVCSGLINGHCRFVRISLEINRLSTIYTRGSQLDILKVTRRECVWCGIHELLWKPGQQIVSCTTRAAHPEIMEPSPMSKSLPASRPWRRRCNAHCKQPPLRYCRNWAIRGRTRCKFHGGMSTGPKTPEGMARTVAAMVAGRRRWIAQLKAQGLKVPGGRKLGSRLVKRSAPTAATPPPTPAVKLPKKYRHMTYDEFIAAGKEALRQLQERLDRGGTLGG